MQTEFMKSEDEWTAYRIGKLSSYAHIARFALAEKNYDMAEYFSLQVQEIISDMEHSYRMVRIGAEGVEG